MPGGRERIAGPATKVIIIDNEGNPDEIGFPLPTSTVAGATTGQQLDTNNTKTVTSADAQPANPWVGDWTQTRSVGFVRQLTVLAATDTSIGGTFTFEYSEDGETATISEVRTITDFVTVRDFDLLNAGEYYRVKFEPALALGSESVIITTTQRRSNDGAFVRLANQQIEKANAAMGQTFAYLKAFKAGGKSANIGVTDDDELLTASSEGDTNVRALLDRTGINATVYGILVDLSDTTNFPHDNTGRIDISLLKLAIDPASNSVGSVDIGVITRIDGTDADIDFGFSAPFGQGGSARILSINNFSPSQLKLGVSGGVWQYGITDVSAANVAAVNTGVTLDSPRGAGTVIPAVGDVIVRYLHTSGGSWDALAETFYHSHA